MYYHNDKEHIISCQAKTPNVINQKLIVYSTSTRSSGSAKKIIISKKNLNYSKNRKFNAERKSLK
jgi:citrate lyase synthetase